MSYTGVMSEGHEDHRRRSAAGAILLWGLLLGLVTGMALAIWVVTSMVKSGEWELAALPELALVVLLLYVLPPAIMGLLIAAFVAVIVVTLNFVNDKTSSGKKPDPTH